MKDILQGIMPFVLGVTCCTLFGMEQSGQGFVFLGLSSGTWGTLAWLGTIASFASIFFRR